MGSVNTEFWEMIALSLAIAAALCVAVVAVVAVKLAWARFTKRGRA
jgi:hypothetical protein